MLKSIGMEKVFIASVKDYSRDAVDSAVSQMFEYLGGAQNIIGVGKNVFIKINLVREMPPEKCGTTHPSIVRAVAQYLKNECNANVVVGDSSGAPYNHAVMNAVYKTCGIKDACEQAGVALNQDFGSATEYVDGKRVRMLDIIDVFTKADVVVNIGKLKTHSFTGFTGVVKNLYGLIPGLVKSQTHSLYPDLDGFTDCLVDIERYASKKIVLHILDAVMGMEGSGPTNGQPRYIGKLIAGKNPYLVDVAGVSFFANPSDMPLVIKAKKRGLLPDDLSDTGIDFDEIKSQRIPDYKTVKVLNTDFNKKGVFRRLLKREWVTQKPKISAKRCKGCAKCYSHCPRQAIEMRSAKNGKRHARIISKKCIRCYCCQELCPFDAVDLKKPFLYRAMKVFNGSSDKKGRKKD